MKKKLVLMTSALMAMSLLTACNQHQHSFKEVAEVPATCTESGVKAYYTCEGCDKIFDADKKETTLEALKIAALGHDYQFNSFVWEGFTAQAKYVCSRDANHVEMHDATVTDEVTTPAGCESKGVRTYTASYDGHTDTKTAEVEATGHTLVAHVAKAETCTEAGNSAYWSCENCDKYFSDENGEHEIAANSWVIAAHAHTMTHHDAVAESCETNGNKEYWTCSECEQYFLDEAGTQVSSAEGIVIAAHHTLTHHDKQPETCTSNGMIEYWHCSVCDKDFFDAGATREIEDEDAYIIPAHHTLTHHDAKEPTCTDEGNIEHWTCGVCGKYFTDKDAENEVATSAVVIPAKGHNMEHHDVIDAKCEETGIVEYWHCTVCEKNFSDSEGNNEISDLVIPATGHAWGTPTYVWSDDHSSCTATRICGNDPSHIDAETANSTFAEVQSGNSIVHRYTVSFIKTQFATQSCDTLTLTLSNDGKSYVAKAGSTTVTGAIIIPSQVNGKPVTSIANDAFKNIRTITSVEIPNTVTSIGTNAFKDCRGLEAISIPSSVTTLGVEAFRSCLNATSLTFGENSKLSAIPEAAFKGCNNIANNVIIPKTVETIGDEAFASVWAPSFTFEEGSVLTTIGVRAFGSSSTMTSISLPESVTSIGMNAFMWCSNLEDFHYQGTIEQWALVSKGSNWNNGIKATVVHCSDGDVTL